MQRMLQTKHGVIHLTSVATIAADGKNLHPLIVHDAKRPTHPTVGTPTLIETPSLVPKPGLLFA